jgi:hypothetical protein
MSRLLIGTLVLLTAPATVMAQRSGQADPGAVVRDYIAAQNRGDIDRLLSFFADQVEIRVGLTTAELTRTAMSENQAQLRARFAQIIRNFPSARSEVLESISDGSVVMTKERTTGLRAGGSDMGLAVYRVRNGKIEAMWVVSSAAASGDN